MKLKLAAISILISVLIYSIVAVAYVHNTFISKNYMKLVYDRLVSIDDKLDRHLEKK